MSATITFPEVAGQEKQYLQSTFRLSGTTDADGRVSFPNVMGQKVQVSLIEVTRESSGMWLHKATCFEMLELGDAARLVHDITLSGESVEQP